MTTRVSKKHIETVLRSRISQAEFRIAAHDEMLKILASKVGTAPTKRELNKVVLAVQERTKLEIGSFIGESMGREWSIYAKNDNYSDRREAKFYNVTSWGSKVLEDKTIEDWQKQRENIFKSLALYNSQLFHLVDILKLLSDQEIEREELEKRQHKEIATFEAQCETSLSGFDYVIKESEELRKKEERDEYHKQKSIEFEKMRGES